MAVGRFCSLQPRLPKTAKFPFSRFFYPTITGRISAYKDLYLKIYLLLISASFDLV